MRYNIDIGENIVRVAKFDKKGVIKGFASCEIPDLSGYALGDKEYTNILGRVINKAGRSAGLPRGFGIVCNMVVGGSHIIARRFTWPSLPYEAQIETAETEIKPYLQGDSRGYIVSHEVLRRVKSEESDAYNIEVIVAAIPKDIASAFVKAAHKATFKVNRLDIRENVRGKVATECSGLDAPPISYAILDFTQPQANMSLYLNGAFYSNRYFSPPKGEAANYDTDTLTSEVASIIDYMQYRERGSKITSVLLMGEENLPGIETSLKDSLDIPIYKTSEWVKPGISENPENLTVGLDAYGLNLTGLTPKTSLNLKPSRIKNKAYHKKMLIGTGILLGATAAVLAVGIIIPTIMRNSLQTELRHVEEELAGYPVTIEDIGVLSNTIAEMERKLVSIDEFFTQWPHARDVLSMAFDLQLADYGFSAVGGATITVTGRVVDFNTVADFVDDLRENKLVESVYVSTAVDMATAQPLAMTTTFNMSIQLKEGMGTR